MRYARLDRHDFFSSQLLELHGSFLTYLNAITRMPRAGDSRLKLFKGFDVQTISPA